MSKLNGFSTNNPSPSNPAQYCQRMKIAVAAADSSSSGAVASANEFYKSQIKLSNSSLFKYFNSEASLVNYLSNSLYSVDPSIDLISAAVIFVSGSPTWQYTIRMNKTVARQDRAKMPDTSADYVDISTKSPYSSTDNNGYPYVKSYNIYGYFTLTDTVNSYIATKSCQQATKCTSIDSVSLRMLGPVDFPSPQV